MKHDDWVNWAEFSPDGRFLVTGADDRTARLWDAASGEPLGEPMRNLSIVQCARFSPNGRLILTVGSSHRGMLWDLSAWPVASPSSIELRHAENVPFGCFSDDGRWVATVSFDNTARIWSIADGRLQASVEHDGTVRFAEFSPDGLRLLTASEDATAVVWDDYDNDGDLDVLTTALSHEGWNGLPQLWLNDGQGNFTRMSGEELFGADVVGAVGIAWGDYDNDGWLDIVMSRDRFTNPKTGESSNFLFRNNGDGTFSRINESEIVTNTGDSQSATWADIDNDGFLDLLICNHNQPNLLMRNLGNDNHWLKLDLTGTVSNADAIGAKVRVKATIQGKELWQLREIGTSQGWLSHQSDMRPHFGLGDAAVAEVVRIEWPSGIVQELADVHAKFLQKLEGRVIRARRV